MADVDELERNGLEDSNLKGKKSNLIPDIVIKLLQVLAIGIFTFIIMVIVAFFVSKIVFSQSMAPKDFKIFSEEYTGKPPVLTWYESLGEIKTNTKDNPPKSFSVKIAFGYAEGNAAILNELGRQKIRLQDIIREYFSQRTAKEIKNETQIKAELRVRINNILRNGEIKEIAFTELNIFDY